MKMCPTCGRVDDEISPQQCGQPITCGQSMAREVVPGKDIVLKCAADGCGHTRVIPAGAAMQGKGAKNIQVPCAKTVCEATAIVSAPKAPESSFTPDTEVAPSTGTKAATANARTSVKKAQGPEA